MCARVKTWYMVHGHPSQLNILIVVYESLLYNITNVTNGPLNILQCGYTIHLLAMAHVDALDATRLEHTKQIYQPLPVT